MNNEQITNKENGRSMVEMLGTLAVVGVLSIGALAGYVYGMDKYRANEVLNSVSQMAIIGTQQRALNPTVTIDLHEFNNKTVYPFEVVTEGVEEGQFAIRFRNIPEGTCKRLLSASKEFVAAADIDVNGVQIDTAGVSCADGDTNAFLYYFDDAMTGDDSGEGGGGDPALTCASALVQVRGCDGSLTPCCPDTDTCEQPTDCGCTDNGDCYGQQVCDGGTCKCPGYGPPEEAERGDLGRDGATCCLDSLAWNGDYYYGINSACGCAYGGSIGSDGVTCCLNGCAGTTDYGYDSTNVAACGCPDGGTFGTDGVTCCKDGHALYSPTAGICLDVPYDSYDSACGCPDGGSIGNDGVTCCKDGASLDPGSMEYDGVNIAACGCPYGGSFGSDGTTCCNGGAWSDMGYVVANYEVCGSCPDGGSPGTDGSTCCKNGRTWEVDGESYATLNTTICGCPDDGSFGSDGTTCCYANFELQQEYGEWHYMSINPSVCGCPEGGTPSASGTSCCKNGWLGHGGGGWVEYDDVDISTCGCPDGGSFGIDGTTCCKGGKAWGEIFEDFEHGIDYEIGYIISNATCN